MRRRSASAKTLARRPAFGVDPNQEPLGVETEPDALKQALGYQSHRPAVVAAEHNALHRSTRSRSARPSTFTFEKLIGWSWSGRWPPGSRDRREQRARRVAAQEGVDVAQMLAEQVVEKSVESARMIVAVPPKPVRALGDIKLIPGSRQCRGIVPACAFFLEREMCGRHPAHPSPWLSSGWPIQMAKLWLIQLPANRWCRESAGGCSRRNSTDLDRPDLSVAGGALVERAEKRHPAVGVVLPAILAVKNRPGRAWPGCGGTRRRSRRPCP